MGRSRKIWGDDAEVFRPERWLEDIEDDDAAEGKVRFVPRSAYEFPVFNAGPRACMGKKMAELQAVYMIASLVWDFEFEEIGEMELNRGEGNTKRRLKERISRNSLTLPMDGGLPCFVKRRRAR